MLTYAKLTKCYPAYTPFMTVKLQTQLQVFLPTWKFPLDFHTVLYHPWDAKAFKLCINGKLPSPVSQADFSHI